MSLISFSAHADLVHIYIPTGLRQIVSLFVHWHLPQFPRDVLPRVSRLSLQKEEAEEFLAGFLMIEHVQYEVLRLCCQLEVFRTVIAPRKIDDWLLK